MFVIIPKKENVEKNFNIFKIIFCKYKDKNTNEIIEDINTPPSDIKIGKTDCRIKPKETYMDGFSKICYNNEYDHESMLWRSCVEFFSYEEFAKNFYMYKINSIIKVDGIRYKIVHKPNIIDYEKVYIPFLLLVNNGFVERYYGT